MQGSISQGRSVEVLLSAAELDVLDRVLSATAAVNAGPRQEAVALLQTEAGRALCRKVLDLRRGQAATPPKRGATSPAVVPIGVRSRSAVSAEGAGLRSDWPAGEWSVEVAEEALGAWEKSGLNEAAFCRATGISRGRIRGWKRKLRPAE